MKSNWRMNAMESIDGSKQYSLRWEKHAFNLATEAGCFFEDESFLDCTLSAEGQCIDAHKIILSASSSYLSSLLKLMPDKHPILIFNDMKFEQLKSLVAFIYNGSVNISENDLHAFLNAAQSLLIKGLYEEDGPNAGKGHEQGRKAKKSAELYDVRKSNNHRLYDRIPPLRKPEVFHDAAGRLSRRERAILPKLGSGGVGGGGGLVGDECEDSLSKLQEISFTKYIHHNLGTRPRTAEEKTNHEAGEERTRGPENYVVRSWKHNSIDDLNGRHKSSKTNFIKKLKPCSEAPDRGRIEQDPQEGKRNDSGGIDGKKRAEESSEGAAFLVEPKQEVIKEEVLETEEMAAAAAAGAAAEDEEEEEDTNVDGHNRGPETEFDARPVPNFYHHPVVDTGIPVPLLMCKTSLSEPDPSESSWMPHVNNSAANEYSPQSASQDNGAQDVQCRTCSQDLPCPTCTKKYKSRYALNRHILYECGKARKSFSCDECGKKVTRQDTLQKHKLIHLVQHLKDRESEAEVTEPAKTKKKR